MKHTLMVLIDWLRDMRRGVMKQDYIQSEQIVESFVEVYSQLLAADLLLSPFVQNCHMEWRRQALYLFLEHSAQSELCSTFAVELHDEQLLEQRLPEELKEPCVEIVQAALSKIPGDEHLKRGIQFGIEGLIGL